MNIYVGNLPYKISEDELLQLFAQYGTVDKVSIIKDKFSGQSKGFGFVEMAKQDEAEEAIKQLNGNAMDGRNITVNAARPRTESSDRPRGGGGKRW
ncbi:MAG: RNA-binding protein [Gammaproteobacteria bacterium]